MNKELELYNININKELIGGGGKNNKIEINFDNAVKKYRKKCIQLNEENEKLKKENEKLKKELSKYKKNILNN